ncbi:Ger(x)C family spore germination protein [Paenibacillus sp. 1001270B_150601_E10]|uniref:Ger(x)C family spore germination protein n=1 Tax=Paenibacillus sp. 1001270B_150601_E10 TaxID=2787079 RepID=UPI00189D9234|nr:Ger(x)C family spore germination protein [Paenibacillus sp. 1001270B_150601_E10]
MMISVRLGLSIGMVLVLLVTGCTHENIVDEVQIISVLGFDKTDRNYHGISMFPDYKESEEGVNKLLEAEGRRARMILAKMSNSSSRPVSIAKMKVMIIGEALAREGINQFSETLCIDPKVSSNVYMVVSEAPLKQIFQSVQQKNPAHLDDLFNQTMENGNIPSSNMHLYLKSYFSQGQDIALPLVNIGTQNRVTLVGNGIFQKDQLKMKIDFIETFLLKLMLGENIYGVYPAEISQRDGSTEIVFRCFSGKLKRKYFSNRHIQFNLSIRGFFQDYPVNMNSGDNDYLIKELEQDLEEKLGNLIAKFQQAQLDPIGIGKYVKQHQRKWKQQAFYETVYPKMKVDVNVKVNLQESDLSGKNIETGE